MSHVRDYLDRGYEVKSSHCDGYGNHWLVLQMNGHVVMAKLPVSMWSGEPKQSSDGAIWELNP